MKPTSSDRWSRFRFLVVGPLLAAPPAFKKCCMRTGRYDGSPRDDYFQALRVLPPQPIEAP